MPIFHPSLKSHLMHAGILLALALPYCINLGTSSIWDANEAFYAETPREMIETGDYLAPQFNFQPRTQKPPLTYYAILVSYKIFGIHEFAVRFPGALAAIGVLLFSYATARSLFNARAAIMCAAICATTARIFILARRLPIDILLLFFLTGILYFLVRAIQKNTRGRWAWVYLFAALGFLTKGPIAIAIPAGALIVWILWSRQSRPALYPLTGAAIFACVALPWYLLIYWTHKWEYIEPFFLRDNLGRYAGEFMGPSRSIFYYFSVFLTDFFPWSLLLLAALHQLWRIRKTEQPLRHLPFGLPVIWCLLTFLIFSVSKNKQEYYIAPLYPASAVVLAGILDRRIPRHASKEAASPNANRERASYGDVQRDVDSLQPSWRIWTYGVLACFILVLSGWIPYILGALIPKISFMLKFVPPLILVVGMGLLIRRIIRREYARFFTALVVPIWAIFIIGAWFYIPALESVRPVKRFCRQIEMLGPERIEAGFFRTSLPSMLFYLHRPIFQESSYERMMNRFKSEKQVFCILAEKDYAYFANQGLDVYILDRHSRFSIRLGDLLSAGDAQGDDLLLVSNRLPAETRFSEGRSRS